MRSEANAPAVPLAPAPWKLKGSGYVVAVRLPEQARDEELFIADSLKGKRRGRLAVLMFVDYSESDVGPYHELLFIPGSFRFNRSVNRSISRIFVSTWESVVNGNINWGIPKERCDFSVSYGPEEDRIALTAEDGTTFAELTLRPRKMFRLPTTTALVPQSLRTLGQHRNGQQYLYAPRSKGHIKPARLVSARFNPAYFPDLTQGKVISCWRVTDFQMVFPVATVEPIEG